MAGPPPVKRMRLSDGEPFTTKVTSQSGQDSHKAIMGSTTASKSKMEQDGLGNQSLLDKIDKLRELNIGANVPLPQLVVVGDQSSGKSSVLESLTGFSFPRASGLCTRYATQITCRREPQEYTDISIIPRPSADPAEQERLKAFSKRVQGNHAGELADYFEQANRLMGIRPVEPNGDETYKSLSTFSENILKIEICGPDQVHLTVIDVPGIFRTATPGLTTEDDIKIVRAMVENYMKDSRTVILAVIPCNVDIATQEILELAKTADPNGLRTMGVLTKPDLAIERATKQAVIDLVLGKRNDLKLGYCVVKNRDADDQNSTLEQRHESENAFFRRDPWSTLAKTRRTGIESLKKRLRDLLLSITKKAFPSVKAEIIKLLRQRREQLDGLGSSRGDSHSQRVYLCRLASEFQRIVACALDANYTYDNIFELDEMKLITVIIGLNERFAFDLWDTGHTWKFQSTSGEDEEDPQPELTELCYTWDAEAYPELDGIIVDPEEVETAPSESTIMGHIKEAYEKSRGPELGTFGGSILKTVFREQVKNWSSVTLSHVSEAIVVVQNFIMKVLSVIITDKVVRDTLCEEVLFDKLLAAHKRAMDHARFLLDVEINARPYTYNHYFAANLNKRKLQRFEKMFHDNGEPSNTFGTADNRSLTIAKFRDLQFKQSNAEQVHEDIHDILLSYYKVSRKRFVDAICQQVIDHFLISGGSNGDGRDRSPLQIFDPDLVMSLDDATLENVAGEDQGTRHQRDVLAAEIKNLEEAVQVLKG